MQQLQTADGVESFPRPKRPRDLSPTHVLKEKGKRRKMGFHLWSVTRAQFRRRVKPPRVSEARFAGRLASPPAQNVPRAAYS